MFKWFRKFCKQIFLSDLKGADETFVRMANDIKTLRGSLCSVYEEVELAIRALDVLGERVGDTRHLIHKRLEKESLKPSLKPKEFTMEERQR